ncbi:hypothetical protein [Spirilliplanes yamanashiensis]|uniref:hypothetical protein n=1 Tax=Spirilliplanes yamanashiensis TaxID=42233 RepID=UPI00194F6BAA|nr:hypothetical protein [Spirilliplanes yamanashiensis]MDP9815825.1 hypothetical protein [Spirilliplanes yamanashiensis]
MEYQIRGACTSSRPDRVVEFDIRTAKAGGADSSIASGEIPCDGREVVNGLSTLPLSVPVTVSITGLSDVTYGYAIVAPQA